ncbi:unnamed protein product [Ectocarpus sp. 8 AP-2014]
MTRVRDSTVFGSLSLRRAQWGLSCIRSETTAVDKPTEIHCPQSMYIQYLQSRPQRGCRSAVRTLRRTLFGLLVRMHRLVESLLRRSRFGAVMPSDFPRTLITNNVD